MRKFSKHTPEQIVVKLEKAEALRGEGMSTAQACRVLGISEATLCRWRQRYGSMNRSFSASCMPRCRAVPVSVLPSPRGGRGENAA